VLEAIRTLRQNLAGEEAISAIAMIEEEGRREYVDGQTESLAIETQRKDLLELQKECRSALEKLFNIHCAMKGVLWPALNGEGLSPSEYVDPSNKFQYPTDGDYMKCNVFDTFIQCDPLMSEISEKLIDHVPDYQLRHDLHMVGTQD
jgi:hypothetical protein